MAKGKLIAGQFYSAPQVRRLQRHVCFLCEHRLSSETCGSIFLPSDMRCTHDLMARKRRECLAASRVRSIRGEP